MVVCYAKVMIKLFGLSSLKEKRAVVRGLVSELKKKFEVSAIEACAQDSKEYMCIGLSFVCLSEADCESKLDGIETYLDQRHTVEEFQYELAHF